VKQLPYDRQYTTMAGFTMCRDCLREYEDPGDRRFHAQPIACPQCGPQLSLWSPEGAVMAEEYAALSEAARAVKAGYIVALKGLGGFQLIADAGSDGAVGVLRTRKRRAAKPFALMYPNLDAVRVDCRVGPAHANLLKSPQSPIVLIPRLERTPGIAPSVAPDTYMLGVMLPYTPLHHLLLEAVGRPLVVTSGNMGEEPICIDEREALDRLRGVADVFLIHNRPIARQVDDSVVSVADGEAMILRRARGYAPAPLQGRAVQVDALAAGGHYKSTVSLVAHGAIFPSQHIGDLDNPISREAYRQTAASMMQLFDVSPQRVIHDLHPDYASTRFALDQQLPVFAVQHHFAHVLSCMAEYGLEGPVLGVSWDGTGYGADGTIWGGEFLRCTRSKYVRTACLRPFALPGGAAAIRDGRRTAISLLHQTCDGLLEGLNSLTPLAEPGPVWVRNIQSILTSGICAPETTSMGRLFDAVASLLGLCHESTFEGQAAMRLERAAVEWDSAPYPLAIPVVPRGERLELDWRDMVRAIADAVLSHQPSGAIAAGFHHALCDALLHVACAQDLRDIVLTGGCFQNTYLLERSVNVLRANGFNVYRHRSIPPNDGGISAGQAWFRPEETAPCV